MLYVAGELPLTKEEERQGLIPRLCWHIVDPSGPDPDALNGCNPASVHKIVCSGIHIGNDPVEEPTEERTVCIACLDSYVPPPSPPMPMATDDEDDTLVARLELEEPPETQPELTDATDDDIDYDLVGVGEE